MAKAPKILDYLPNWTEKAVTDTTGRDPLGLNRVSNLLIDYLLTGIVTGTDRARYYAYYCWALWKIENESPNGTYDEFETLLRRLDAAVSLASLRRETPLGQVGVRAASRALSDGKSSREFSIDFKPLPSQSLGGFGQYYAGSMYQLGLTYRPEGNGIDRITDGIAKSLAEAVEKSLRSTPFLKEKLYRKKFISESELDESAERLSLDWIRESEEERKLMTDLLFGLAGPSPSEACQLRRSTLVRALHLVSEYERRSMPVKWENLDIQLVYAPSYYGELWSEDGKHLRYVVPPIIDWVQKVWCEFSIHQYLILVFENLLSCVLDFAGQFEEGMTIDDLIESATGDALLEILKDKTGSDCSTPWKLMKALGLESLPDKETALRIRLEFEMSHNLSEESLFRQMPPDPESRAAHSILGLAVLYGKWRNREADEPAKLLSSKTGTELWAANILPVLDHWLSQDCDWKTAMGDLIRPYILDQHDRVMYEKRRLDSCWLTRHEGKIVKEQDYKADRRASRHWQVTSILYDLRLLRDDENNCLFLTSEGHELLNKLLGGKS